ncbi:MULTISPECIES: hypothetical protein [unclassified Streptomyces]|uniref:hypothetical protein n=1 Tax=unclassified Streptomyces TaxID=2593676 RepID=UPI000DB926BB|nr:MULTISPECIES: hypothetical protein [unclassified Streptomyces]MYT72986.1 hypothetical protein [Streptomyces sp. SID8367]RAJ73781.1 hypothetical protein K377_06863 [Streptomyces sp. PsTaAH-137]
MSVAPFPSVPGPRARARTWAGTLLLVLALLLAPFAAAPVEAAVPVAAVSCEGGEHHDAPEAALRLPTGHPTRLPAGPVPRPVPRVVPLLPTAPAADPARLSHRALRTVVLRC